MVNTLECCRENVCGGRKTGEPREKSSESDRDQQSVLVYTRLGSKLVALQKLKYLGNDV